MTKAIYHVHTIAFGYDDRSDWAIRSCLNAEAVDNYLLERVILPEPGSAAQKYRPWAIATMLVENSALRTMSDPREGGPAEVPGIS